MAKQTPGDASASAESQAQQTSNEPDAKAKTPERRAEATGDPQYFEGTVVKIDADGNEVMSDHLMPGETLRRSVTELHFANPAQAKANADEERRENAKRDADQGRDEAEQVADARADEAKNKR